MKSVLLFIFCLLKISLSAQVSINTTNAPPDPSAMLDIYSTDKGVLLPRFTYVQKENLRTQLLQQTNQPVGLMIFQTDSVIGFYYWTGISWFHLTEGIENMSTNTIPKWDGQKLTNSELFESGGNIGIGTTNPTQKLDVDGQIRIQGGNPEQGKVLTSASDGTGTWKNIGNEHINAGNGLEWNGDTLHSFWKQSGNNIFNNNIGNVGIGTNNPDALLTLSDTTTVLKLHNPDTIGSLAIEFVRGNANFGTDSLTDWRLENIGDNLYFTKGLDSTVKNMIVITNDGKLGVGTNNPVSIQHVLGQQINTFTGLNRGIMSLSAPYSAQHFTALDFLYNENANPSARIAAYFDGSGSKLVLGTSNNYATGITNEALTIDKGGNVGIGTTTPVHRLTVNGNIVNTAPSLGYIGLTGDLPGYASGLYPTIKTNHAHIYFSVGNQYSSYISTSGSYTVTSSREKKENIEYLDYLNVLEKINLLDITKWNFKNEETHIKHIGPFAEDFYALFGLNGKDNTMISHIDPSGVALAGVKGLIIKNEVFLNTIQEQNKRIENLENIIYQLLNK